MSHSSDRRLSRKTLPLLLAAAAVITLPGTGRAQRSKGLLGYDVATDSAFLKLRGDSDQNFVWLGAVGTEGSDRNRGRLALYDLPGGQSFSSARATLSAGDGLGALRLYDTTGHKNVALLAGTGNNGYGHLALWREDSDAVAVRLQAAGETQLPPRRNLLELRGTSNYVRAGLSVWLDNYDCGILSLSGPQGGLEFNACTNEKNAVMNHPHDPDARIYYAALEGPEVGLYVRGTGRLVKGRAVIELPDHFAMVASPTGLTAQLTPRSPDSPGLAIVSLSHDTLEVAELRPTSAEEGGGRYEFDYQVHGRRADREDYEVVRKRSDDDRPMPDRSKVDASFTEPNVDDSKDPS